MPVKKPKKEKPKKKWKPFAPEVYQQEISQLAHFSAKTVNSNTPAFGVRIGVKDRIDIPYVAVSAMDMSAIPVDYEKNAGSIATIVAQVSAVVEEGLQDYEEPSSKDIDAISSAASSLRKKYATPLSLVGMRLRQVIVQDVNGEDIALTPLHSAGFSKQLESRLEKELEIEKELTGSNKYRPRGFLGIGGANPQNVGRHTRSMQRPLWFTAPKEDMDIRKAFAFHYRGISLAIPNDILAEFHKWRQRLLAKHLDKIPSDQNIREKEKEYLLHMVKAVIDRAAMATLRLNKYQDRLPDGELTSKSLNPVMRGLLDHDTRDLDWKRDFAKAMHSKIIDSKIWVDGKKMGLNISEDDSDRWISIIEEAL
ncbi:MAG TPA: hypothetical protein ENI77_02040 [Nitrospirae bacterium]|nr:hypothetical protein [Nitrospirota bacterium]